MNAYLRIKVISLAYEAKAIRKDENYYLAKARRRAAVQKSGDQAKEVYWGLRRHRIIDVRREARVSCLAYGYLRGRAYKQLEAKCYEQPDWTRVADIVRRFGDLNLKADQIKERIKQWREAANESETAPTP